jgi:hypothetical protein
VRCDGGAAAAVSARRHRVDDEVARHMRLHRAELRPRRRRAIVPGSQHWAPGCHASKSESEPVSRVASREPARVEHSSVELANWRRVWEVFEWAERLAAETANYMPEGPSLEARRMRPGRCSLARRAPSAAPPPPPAASTSRQGERARTMLVMMINDCERAMFASDLRERTPR